MTRSAFERLLRERILVLDGGLGTMIQQFKLTEQDYRGERFADFPGQLKGNNDLLNITRPDVLKEIRRLRTELPNLGKEQIFVRLKPWCA